MAKKAAVVENEKEKINYILIEIRNITPPIPKNATAPTYITYVTHVEEQEKDIWEEIGENVADAAMFLKPHIIRGAKYLYNQYQKRRLPEPRPGEPTSRTDAVHNFAYTQTPSARSIAAKIDSHSFRGRISPLT